MKNFFIKEEFSFFVLLYTFIKKDTILTLIYIVMKISHIEHLGIAVKSIEEALPYYENVLGLKCYNIETVEDQKVRTAFPKVGDVKIELLEPTSPESTIAKFIEKNNGNGGMHHLAFAVEDGVAGALAEVEEKRYPPYRQSSPQRCRRSEHCIPASEVNSRCPDRALRETGISKTLKSSNHKLYKHLKNINS